MKRAALLIILGLFVSGCAQTVTKLQLDDAYHATRRDTLGTFRYCGRPWGYAAFRAGWNVGWSDYQLKAPNTAISDPMPYTWNSKKWRYWDGPVARTGDIIIKRSNGDSELVPRGPRPALRRIQLTGTTSPPDLGDSNGLLLLDTGLTPAPGDP